MHPLRRFLRRCLRSGLGSLRLLLLSPAIPYGGQAAIEGVMMKGRQDVALAMRRRDGSIEVLDRPARPRFPALVRLPLLRGVLILFDMMLLGMWALSESGRRFERDMAAEEEQRKQAEARGAGTAVGAGTLTSPQKNSRDANVAAPTAEADPPGHFSMSEIVMLVLSLALSLAIFKVLPAVAATYIAGWLHLGGVVMEKARLGYAIAYSAAPTFSLQLAVNAIEGLIKFSIFVGYIWAVGRLADVRRVFEYHGAEHIVINAYEDDASNQEMTFIQSHGVAHPRCGTSFIAIMILLSIFVFAVIDWAVVHYLPQFTDPVRHIPEWFIRWPLRIIGVLPLAGLSYEVIRGAFKYYGNPLLRPLLRFGMLFQVLTVRRPSDEQVEVSLAAFNRVRFLSEGIAAPKGKQ